jgi:hypothetical protein
MSGFQLILKNSSENFIASSNAAVSLPMSSRGKVFLENESNYPRQNYNGEQRTDVFSSKLF